jgi:glycosyltransferase involved in cell wall biosynthesis
VHCTAESRDCFDHAESLLRLVSAQQPALVCFWNVDPKVKLLLVKMLGHSRVRFIDVSPGGYSFAEMTATSAFQQWIAYSEAEYYERLSRLVLKYRGAAPRGRVAVIPNGVPMPVRTKRAIRRNAAQVVVSGRIAPSKYLLEIVAAMRRVWRSFLHAELHILGAAEPRHRAYLRELIDAAGRELGGRIVLAGASFDAPDRLADYDVAVVVGENQGCPNAVLEALAAGVPVVANDSGGTRDAIRDGRTGVLLADPRPETIAAGICRVLADPAFAARLSARGRAHAACRYSMTRMAESYARLFTSVIEENVAC